jgi:hypothetical protein
VQRFRSVKTLQIFSFFLSFDEGEWLSTRLEERAAGPGDDFAFALIRLERRQWERKLWEKCS